MGCAATLAEWLAELAGSDPFGALRPLPVGLGVVWWSRAAWAVAATVVLVVGHQLLAFGLAPGPRHLFLLWIGGATLAIAALGNQLRRDVVPARRHGETHARSSLGLAVVASLMFPARRLDRAPHTRFFHSSRRLSHWDRARGRLMLTITGLSRSYGALQALDDVSFEVHGGEILGLLGRTAQARARLLRTGGGPPAAGSWFGRSRGDRSLGITDGKRSVGSATPRKSRAFYEELSAEEYLAFVAAVRELDPTESRQRAQELFEKLGLEGRTDEPVQRFSTACGRSCRLRRRCCTDRRCCCVTRRSRDSMPAATWAPRKSSVRLRLADVRSSSPATSTETIERLCDRAVLLHRGRGVPRAESRGLGVAHTGPLAARAGIPDRVTLLVSSVRRSFMRFRVLPLATVLLAAFVTPLLAARPTPRVEALLGESSSRGRSPRATVRLCGFARHEDRKRPLHGRRCMVSTPA
jgi:ABC-type Na+ transport system ATPase subunit NatA